MTSIYENVACLDTQDWVTILNMAIQLGGLDSLTINSETLAEWQKNPNFKPQLKIANSPTGGFIFTPTNQPSASNLTIQ